MAARRNVLNGASVWEREERANQQRDYAAQLQQQVLQKQAKQEQEKARRQQEAREELELLQERERATATRKHQPQQEQPVSETIAHASPPQRAVSVPMMPPVELQQQISPLKSSSFGPGFTNSSNTGTSQATEFAQHNATPTPATSSTSESYTPALNSTPSIFESLLREPGIGARSTSFYDDLAGLQRLAVELDSQTKQRRTKAQGNYVKPNFLHQEEPTLAAASPSLLRSPVKVNSYKVNLGDNHQHAATDSRMQFDGLLGESMLLPLTTTTPFSSLASGKDSPAKPNRDIKRTDEADMSTMEDLDNHSEMVRFGASEPWQEAR